MPNGPYGSIGPFGPTAGFTNGDGSWIQSVGSINNKLRDAGESYPNDFYQEIVVGPDDFVVARGNTGGAGWIEISKSPLTTDDETALRITQPVNMPTRMSLLTSLTHRNAGQQIASFEFLSDDTAAGLTPLDPIAPVAILDATQATTTITINFSAAPPVPFRIGQIVDVYGFVDTRLNVSNATVATVVSETQITIVGNDYTFTSTSISLTLGSGAAFIRQVDPMERARNGVAMVHGSATATNRRFYARSQGGQMRPSGTLAGAHATTTGTDAATAAATGYNVDAWLAPLETIIDVSRNGVLFSDRAPDANAALTTRHRFSQVVPNPSRKYWMQFRLAAAARITRPIAKIVSIAKTGTTTATVITDGPHNLVTGQYVGGYGVRDQTNFANLTAAATCTVVDATTFTVVWGAAVTATSYGGFVMLVQGQQALGGAIAQVAQSVARTNNIVTVTGNTTWAAPAVIGNIVELYGCRDNATGADLGLDGSYVVANIATTALTLIPAVDGKGVLHAPTGANIVSTNCGGGVIQRLGYRIHAAMAVDFGPILTESSTKGVSDAGEGGAMTVNGTVTANIGTGTLAAVTALTGGGAAEDAAAGANPVVTGGVVRTAAAPATLVAGDAARHTMTSAGAMTMALGAPVASAEVASAARTSTGNSGTISVPTGGAISGILVVSAQSGTTPTLDVTLEESYDNGTTWTAIWAAPRFAAATGNVIIPAMAVMGLRRWVWTIAGTTPSFTFAINTNQISVAAPIHRNLIDRTIVPTTLNSATPALYIEGCVALSLAVVLGAATTPPVYGVQLSADGTNWYDSGMSLTSVASTTQGAAISGFAAKFARGYVRTAGATVTQTYVELRAIG